MAVEAEDLAVLGKQLPQRHAFRSQVPDWFEERAYRKEMQHNSPEQKNVNSSVPGNVGARN